MGRRIAGIPSWRAVGGDVSQLSKHHVVALGLYGYVEAFPPSIAMTTDLVREYFETLDPLDQEGMWSVLTYAPKVFCLRPSPQELRVITEGVVDRGYAVRRLRALDYRDYLKTPWWRFMRYTKLEIAGASCQLCSAEQRQIDIHHRTYERLGDEDLDDLTVLCRNCHAKFHGKVHS